METTIAILNKPNQNGRVYTKESFGVLPEKVYVTLGINAGADIDLSKICGEASNISFDGDTLKANISLLDTASGRLAKVYLENSSMSYVIAGEGTMKDSIVENYNLCSINLIKESESSFKDM
jgi:hypothetical protein